jgi:hypothetical protein
MRQRAPKRFIRPTNDASRAVPVEGTVTTTRLSDERSVVADNGAFTSPLLPPRSKFDYLANTAGTINCHDGTRPYAVGTLEVS